MVRGVRGIKRVGQGQRPGARIKQRVVQVKNHAAFFSAGGSLLDVHKSPRAKSLTIRGRVFPQQRLHSDVKEARATGAGRRARGKPGG